jgi:hypothetical protein
MSMATSSTDSFSHAAAPSTPSSTAADDDAADDDDDDAADDADDDDDDDDDAADDDDTTPAARSLPMAHPRCIAMPWRGRVRGAVNAAVWPRTLRSTTIMMKLRLPRMMVVHVTSFPSPREPCLVMDVAGHHMMSLEPLESWQQMMKRTQKAPLIHSSGSDEA